MAWFGYLIGLGAICMCGYLLYVGAWRQHELKDSIQVATLVFASLWTFCCGGILLLKTNVNRGTYAKCDEIELMELLCTASDPCIMLMVRDELKLRDYFDRMLIISKYYAAERRDLDFQPTSPRGSRARRTDHESGIHASKSLS